MGYVGTDGKYHKEAPDMDTLLPRPTSMHKQADHDRQRADNAKDLLQPYNRDGSVNQAFVEAFPEESRETYKFIPTSDEILRGE